MHTPYNSICIKFLEMQTKLYWQKADQLLPGDEVGGMKGLRRGMRNCWDDGCVHYYHNLDCGNGFSTYVRTIQITMCCVSYVNDTSIKLFLKKRKTHPCTAKWHHDPSWHCHSELILLAHLEEKLGQDGTLPWNTPCGWEPRKEHDRYSCGWIWPPDTLSQSHYFSLSALISNINF